MRQGQRQLDALPHAFAITCDFSMRGASHPHAFNCGIGLLNTAVMRIAEQPQERVQEFMPSQTARKAIELRGVANDVAQPLGLFWRNTQHASLAPRGPDKTSHYVHERGFARSVRANQAGDSRRDRQRNAVYAENLAVEAR